MDAEKWQNLGYLFWAFTFFWALLGGYLLFLSSRLKRLRREMDELRRSRDAHSGT